MTTALPALDSRDRIHLRLWPGAHRPAPSARVARPAAANALSASQCAALVFAIAGLHGLLGWALLQVPAVRQAVLGAAPIFVDLIPPDAPPLPQPPPKAPALAPRAPPLVASKAAPAPAAALVVETIPEAPPPPVVVAVEAPPPAPEVPPPPKVIPASGVQYLVPPPLEYPRASRRMGEAGKVLVRVYIDEQGLPHKVQVTQSSGHARLDEAAVAAVQQARFKPYAENGRAMPGWAFVPLTFDLER